MGYLDRKHREPVSATTDAHGTGSAASIKLGEYRKSLQVMYNLTGTNGSLVVEVSTDGTDWDPHHRIASGSLSSGSEQAVTDIPDTPYQYARVYYDHTSDEVTEIKIVGK